MGDRAKIILVAAALVTAVAVISGLVVASGSGTTKVTIQPVLVAEAAATPVAATPVAGAPGTPVAGAPGTPVAGANAMAGAGPLGPVALTGCPPPPRPPPAGGGAPAPHPATVVPESALPVPPPPAPRLPNVAALAGKGMWIWQSTKTEGGDVDAIVPRAVQAGLTQLWVRVGDSVSGFYGAAFLDALVPAAHRAGVAVIGWGFPFLYDPVGDAAWTALALAWRAPGGDRLDGFSADIETASEGTMLSARRASVYLGLVRPGMTGRPLVATVFPPTAYWLTVYPYRAMAPYVDAFAPMEYWSCREPGAAAASAVSAALASMAPVHVIGQAFDDGPSGGRVGSPAPAEISRFLDSARRAGAVGASFWVWQDATAGEWGALAAYPWSGRPAAGTVMAGA